MWIQRGPLACGYPPCPICYEWGGEDEFKLPAEVKVATDLLGRAPTEAEAAEVRKGLEKNHEAAMARIDNPDPVLTPGERAALYDAEQRAAVEQRQLEGLLAKNAKAIKAAKENPAPRLVLDQMEFAPDDVKAMEEQIAENKKPSEDIIAAEVRAAAKANTEYRQYSNLEAAEALASNFDLPSPMKKLNADCERLMRQGAPSGAVRQYYDLIASGDVKRGKRLRDQIINDIRRDQTMGYTVDSNMRIFDPILGRYS